jgi:hypothetical protein
MTDPAHNRTWTKPPEVEAILAIGSLALFAYVTWAVIWNTVPAENEKYAMLMLGALIGVVKDTFGRYFQATKGAQEQRKDAAKVAETAAATAATLAAVAAGPAAGTATITTAPDVDVTIRDAEDAGELPPAERLP